MKKLAIVTTHPIQYNAPLFSLLATRRKIAIKVFYTWGQAIKPVYDPGFGKHRAWDIPLLDGYAYSFLKNIARRPGSHHFWGINNPDLIKEIGDWQPDAILVFGWSFYSHLKCIIHFKKRVPVFFRGDSTLLDEKGGFRSLLRRTTLTWIYRFIDVAFYTGKCNKAYFRKYGLKEKQLVNAPHAVENNRFSSITPEEQLQVEQWKEKLGFTERDWVVLFVGKLEEKKNPKFLLELAREISEKNIKFLFVGNGILESNLKRATQDKRVVFLDFQNQSKMPLVYRLGNVLLLPSKGPGETWGLAANEAMNCGLPVILSDKVGGAPDLVVEKKNGIVFTLQEKEKVVAYIRDLYRSKEIYQCAQKKAVKHIQEFSLAMSAQAIEQTVQKSVH